MTSSKRVLRETGSNPDDNPKEKRLRPSLSFRSVMVEVMLVKCFHQTLSVALEPLLRRVVSEEVDDAIRRKILTLSRSPSLRIKEVDNHLKLKLIFAKQPSLPIFTGSKIHDVDTNSLEIHLVREDNNRHILPHPLKIELVPIDGDFCSDRSFWRTEEFESKIIKERHGRRPLLAGELVYTMRDGLLTVGDIEFTDNSSWIRGRKFRVGARVVSTDALDGVGVLQAVSDPFVVRDHRGELYKKHYPPILSDQVWRLEKIGKDGTFHQKLATHGIKTVQDFLKLSNVNPTALRQILGVGMSDKMWDVSIKHAKTCVADTKVYMLRGQNYELALSSICEVMWANVDATFYTPSLQCTIFTKMRIEELVKYAYENWGSLEEVGPPHMLGQSYSYNWENEAHMSQVITDDVEMGCGYYSGSTSYENLPN